MDQYIGKLLDNRYEILEVIGTGGMARVYKARCHRLNRLVAIKILREDLAQDAEFRRRFHDESQAVAMLSHPNIVAVYDVSRSSELEYIVMELIDGITLKQYMQKKGNKLNWREALHFTTQIVKALGHAHSRGIIHRDIKPHNIMVLRDGSVKVADFGIARVASGGHSTLTQEALGSVHYISPEQARGSHIDARSDLYSAGVVLYEMITGRLPFEGDTPVSVAIQHINSIPLSPREIDPTIPEALEEITMKAMATNPDNRYASADEMLADLEEFRKNPNINFEYSLNEFMPEEEPDEDKTQIRSAPVHHSRELPREHRSSGRTGGRRHTSRRDEEDEEEDRRPDSSRWVIVAAVAAILLFVAGVFFFLYRTLFSGLFTPAQLDTVPNLVGMTYEEVLERSEELLGDRFTLVQGETVSDDAAEGTIIRQDPEGDSQVGSVVTEITVTISSGPETIIMQDVSGMTYSDAYQLLTSMGLSVPLPEYQYDDEVERNYVISFTPLEGAVMSPGDEVHLVVSQGKESVPVTLTSLINRSREDALSDIANLGLVADVQEDVYDDTIPEGYVCYQYPAAGTSMKEGDTVTIQVSMGPDPATQEPEMVTKEVSVALPDDGGIVSVTVMMDGAVVHTGEWDTSMNTAATFNVTAEAGSSKTLTIYINGVEDGYQVVEF